MHLMILHQCIGANGSAMLRLFSQDLAECLA